MAKLFINGEVGMWANEQKNTLFFAPAEPLDVFIDSPGGSVTDGNAIAALLRQHAADYGVEVRTVGIGLVASIATMILLSGSRVEMDKDAFLMIHNPFADYVSGGSKELRQLANTLEVIKNTLADRYVQQIEKAGKLVDGDKQKTKNIVLQYMASETWFTAQEALDFGLIDGICNCNEEEKQMPEPMSQEQMMVGATMVNSLQNTPAQIKAKYSNSKPIQKMENITKEEKSFLAKLMSFFFKNEATETAAPEAIAPAPVVETAPQIVEKIVEIEKTLTESEMIAELEKKGYKMQRIEEVTAVTTENEALKNELATLKNSVKDLEAQIVAKQAQQPITSNTEAAKEAPKFNKFLSAWNNKLNNKL